MTMLRDNMVRVKPMTAFMHKCCNVHRESDPDFSTDSELHTIHTKLIRSSLQTHCIGRTSF